MPRRYRTNPDLPLPEVGHKVIHADGNAYFITGESEFTSAIYDADSEPCFAYVPTDRPSMEPYIRPALEFQQDIFKDGEWVPRFKIFDRSDTTAAADSYPTFDDPAVQPVSEAERHEN